MGRCRKYLERGMQACVEFLGDSDGSIGPRVKGPGREEDIPKLES